MIVTIILMENKNTVFNSVGHGGIFCLLIDTTFLTFISLPPSAVAGNLKYNNRIPLQQLVANMV